MESQKVQILSQASKTIISSDGFEKPTKITTQINERPGRCKQRLYIGFPTAQTLQAGNGLMVTLGIF